MNFSGKWKPSIYMLVVEETAESVTLYHTCTKALIRVPQKAYRMLQKVGTFTDPQSQPYLPSFQKLGFCLPLEIDEAEEFSRRSLSALHAETGELFFTIAPTLACNYRCSYCFEEGVPAQTMTEETVEKLCRFIEDAASRTANCRGIRIKWFGGEPLAAFPILHRISDRIKDYCTQHGLSLQTRIITNGSLLTEEMLEILDQYQLQSIQIAMDGTESTYCRCKGAAPADYRHIIELLRRRCDQENFIIRCNCLPDNLQSLMELTTELYADEKLRKHISLYLAQVKSETVAVLSAQEYADAELTFLKHLYDLGWHSQVRNALPSKRTTLCDCLHPQSYLIDAAGDFFCCESQVGSHAARIASLDDGTEQIFRQQRTACQTVCKPLRSACQKCSFYPVCFSGCPKYPRSGKDCSIFQRQLRDTLSLSARAFS